MVFVLLFLVFCLGSSADFLGTGPRLLPPAWTRGCCGFTSGHGPECAWEETARQVDEIDNLIRRVIPPSDLANVLDNIGLPNSGLNQSYGNNGTFGESDAEILIGLKPDRGNSTHYYMNQLRTQFATEFPGTQFFFQPADMVSQILNFGAPSPIDIQLVGPNQQANYALAQQMVGRIQQIPGAVDVHVHQMFSYPTLFLDVDRTRAQSVGLNQNDVANSLLLTLSSSSQTAPSFWVNTVNGIQYNVAVQVPQYKIDTMQALENIPVTSARTTAPQVLGNLSKLGIEAAPAEISHYNSIPMIDVYASVDGRDLGGVDTEIQKVLKDFNQKLPRGTQVERRGQVATMTSSFTGLAAGLAVAIVLVYLLIVINFQSWLDPFIIITALPGALAGILWMLFLTHTTLSVPSLTGVIMCMGVATANSILMVSFAREQMEEGLDSVQAALQAGYIRMRPVIMTARWP